MKRRLIPIFVVAAATVAAVAVKLGGVGRAAV